MEFNFDEIYNQILKEKEECKDPCGICYSNLDKKIVKLNCSHRYHYDCLFKIKKYNKIECPYCRYCQYVSTLKKKCVAIVNNVKCNKVTYLENNLCLKHINYQEKKCEAIFRSGKNKGKPCCKSVFDQDSKYCKRHQNYKEKKIKKLCKFILTRGKNKGNECCKTAFEETDYCKKHQNKENKNVKKLKNKEVALVI